MRLKLEEQLIIFASIIKWLILASTTGALTGIVSSLFILALHWITERSEVYYNAFYFLPLTLLIASWLGNKIAHHDLSTDRLIFSINNLWGKVNIKSIPVKIITVLLIIGTGGSAGKESPCAQMGAGISSLLSDLFRMDERDRKKLVICGFSAGFACVFGTPMSGALFGIEVLMVGVILYDVLFPAFVASITAYHISTLFGVHYFRYPLDFVPVFNESFFLYLILGAIFFGLCSLALIELLNTAKRLSAGIKIHDYWKAITGGVVLILLTMLTSREYLGLGLNTMELCLKGGKVEWYSFIMKAIFTAITLSVIRSGSIITPILFIGATAGNIFGNLCHLDVATFSAIGFVSLLAGTTNTPLAMSIMAIEMFGAAVAPYAGISCIVSFLMSGHRSLYSSQVLTISKARSIIIEAGKEIKVMGIEIKVREKSPYYIVRNYMDLLLKKIRKK